MMGFRTVRGTVKGRPAIRCPMDLGVVLGGEELSLLRVMCDPKATWCEEWGWRVDSVKGVSAERLRTLHLYRVGLIWVSRNPTRGFPHANPTPEAVQLPQVLEALWARGLGA